MCSQTIHLYRGDLNLEAEIEKCNVKNIDEAVNICDLTNLINQYNTWNRLMPNISPYYAVKCNDESLIIKTLADLGIGFDCASKNEIKQVLEIGVSPDRILFANPMKSISHIQYAKSENVIDSTVDNEFEIYKIFKHYPESNIILRYRSDAKKALSPLGNKFGCKAEEDAGALMLLAKSLNMNMTGISFHVGSGCGDIEAYKRAIQTGSNIFKLGKFIGHIMEILDIGGGFPGDDDYMFSQIAEIVNKSIRKYFRNLKVKVIAEPGRFFVSTAYTTICKVCSKREMRGRDGTLEKIIYYVNDGIYGTFNIILYEDIKLKAIHFKNDDSKTYPSLIWGPTCDARDLLCENVRLPNLMDGDVIAFPNMGAYSIPTSSVFNGFTLPKTRFYLKEDYIAC